MLTKIIIKNGHLFSGDVEFTKCTSADLRELPTPNSQTISFYGDCVLSLAPLPVLFSGGKSTILVLKKVQGKM